MGRQRSYALEELSSDARRRVTTNSAGLLTQSLDTSDGARSTTLSNGSMSGARSAPDPRFGMQSARLGWRSLTVPSGLSSTSTTTWTATLTDPGKPPQLKFSDRNAVAERSRLQHHLRCYSTNPYRQEPHGARGRVCTRRARRIVESRAPGFLPLTYQYDARGRLTSLLQGTRSFSIQYDSRTVSSG